MSASTEIFDLLNSRALAWTREHLAGASTGKVDRKALERFLGEQAALLRPDVAGSSDLTDGTVRLTVDSVARFYAKWTPRGIDNTALFETVAASGRTWTRDRLAHRRTRSELKPGDYADLDGFVRPTSARACVALGLDPVAARAEKVILRVKRFCCKMRRGKRSQKVVMVRPASRAEKQRDLDETVEMALHGLLEGQTAPARTVDQVMALMKGRKRNAAGALVPAFSRTAVARAVARLRGKPRREAAIAALRPVVRDLIAVIDLDLPASTVSIVSIESLAARLWSPQASQAGRCVHKRRLLDALAEISPSLGIHICVEGENVLVGRGRRIPAAGPVLDKVLKRTPRALPPGLMPARMGVWGTKTGEVVQAALRVVTSPAHEDDVDVVARALGHPNGCPAMRELAAGGKSDPKWYPTARERPARRRPDPRVRHDVWDWAMRVYGGSQCIIADNWSPEDKKGALSILETIQAGGEGGIPGVLDHLSNGIHDLRFARAGTPILAQDGGEAWADMQDIEILLDGANFDTWESIVMGTANAGRPGRRPARIPALASRSIPVVPPAPEPGPGAPRPSGVTVYEASKPMPKRIAVPAEVLEMMDCRVTRRAIAAEAWEIRTLFTEEDSGFQVDPAAGKDGLRQALKTMPEMAPTVAKVDKLMDGSVRYALLAAGILLDRHGAKATLLASMIIGRVQKDMMLGDAKGLSELAWWVHDQACTDFPGTVGPKLSHARPTGTLSV